MPFLLFVSLFFCNTLLPEAFGQTNTTSSTEFSVQAGPFLPTRIPGVTETLPFSGIRISQGIKSFRPEWTLFHGRSQGVIYYLSHLSVRNWLDRDSFKLFWMAGLNISLYQRAPRETTSFAFTRASGFHFGFGILTTIAKHLDLRADFYFHNTPGYSGLLMLGFSVPMDWGASSTNE